MTFWKRQPCGDSKTQWWLGVWEEGGWEDALEKEMATRSRILAWKTSWTEEPGGLQSMGCKELDLATQQQQEMHKSSKDF